jgi:hypothetical protein
LSDAKFATDLVLTPTELLHTPDTLPGSTEDMIWIVYIP